MVIDIDEDNGEYFLRFVDEDDRIKKSKFLKVLKNNNVGVVTMTLEADSGAATEGQRGLFKAFLILLNDYTGSEYGELKNTIFKELETSQEEVDKYSKIEYSEFIEKLFRFCSHNVGIEVELKGGKLRIIK